MTNEPSAPRPEDDGMCEETLQESSHTDDVAGRCEAMADRPTDRTVVAGYRRLLREAAVEIRALRAEREQMAERVGEMELQLSATLRTMMVMEGELARLSEGERVEGWAEPYEGINRMCYNFDPDRRYVNP